MQFEKSHSTSKRFVLFFYEFSFDYIKIEFRENRVGSRLTRYEKLPRIGSSHEYIPRPPPTPQSNHSVSNPRQRILIKQKEEQEQQPVLIAIKLNDGTRLEKEFHSNNTINDIIKFIKSKNICFDQNFYLSSGDVPKRQFLNFNLTLSQANILTRTVLFIDRN